MKPDYTKFDARLLELIGRGFNTMAKLLENKELMRMAKPFCTLVSPDEFRVIDRRLQAARKAQKIQFNGKHWELMS